MKHILVNISQSIDTTIERVEVMPDHVHLLISIPPKFSVSDIVRQLKGVSSRIWSGNQILIFSMVDDSTYGQVLILSGQWVMYPKIL